MKIKYYIFFFLLGLFTLLAQTILLREYIYFFKGSELSIALFYFSWFIWIATGAFLPRRLEGIRRFVNAGFDLLTALYPLLLPLQILAIRSLRLLMGYESYEAIPPHISAIAALVSNLPLSLFTGMLFTSGAARFRQFVERSVTAGFIMESAGSFIGGALATYLIYTAIKPLDAAYLASALFFAHTLLSSLEGIKNMGTQKRHAFSALFSSFLLILSIAFFLAGGFDRIKALAAAKRFSQAVEGANLITEEETEYQSVSIGRLGNQYIALQNGVLSLSFPPVEERRAIVGILFGQSEEIRNLLLIGEGALSLADAVLEYPVKGVTLLIEDCRFLEGIKKTVPSEMTAFLREKRLKIICGDPRVEIGKIKETRKMFDAAAVFTSDPETILTNRYFTQEFFSEVAQAIDDNGIFVHCITSAENFAGTEIIRYGQSLYATLSLSFADITMTTGEKSLFLAAKNKGFLSLDFSRIKRNIESYFQGSTPPFPIETINPYVLPERVKFVRKLYAESELKEEDLINKDGKPITFFYAMLVGLKHTGSFLVNLLHGIHREGIYLSLALAGVFLILALHRRAARPVYDYGRFIESYTILSAGAAAITLQIILMAEFQARFGYLYREIGMVNALYMAGSAAGGLLFGRISPRLGAISNILPMTFYIIFILALLLMHSTEAQNAGQSLFYRTALTFYPLFLINGLIAGSVWPLVEKFSRRTTLETASRLESYDHIGAASGALICGLLMFPLLGTAGTLFGLVAVFACGILIALFDALLIKKRPSFLESLQKREQPSFANLKLSYILFGAILFFILANILFKNREFETAELGEAQLMEVSLSGKKPFEKRETPFLHYTFDDEKSGKVLEVALSSLAVAKDVKGFGGQLNLLLKIDGDGIIKTVKLLSSKETPTYISGIDRWLKSFEEKSIREDFRFEEGGEIDVMTGATITSEAALKIINRTKNAVAEEILKIPVNKTPEKGFFDYLLDVRTIYVVLAFTGSIAIYFLAGGVARLLWLFMNLIVGGVLFNIQFSLTHLYNLLSLELPSLDTGYLFILFAGIIILLPLVGPVYCSQMCPFGAFQEILSRIFSIDGLRPSRPLENSMRGIKYVLLLFFAALFLMEEPHGFFAYDPLANFFNFKYTSAMLLLIALILILSLFYSRFYCRYFCPVGAFFNLFNMIALKLPWIRKHRYATCFYNVRDASDFECIQCNRCLTVPKSKVLEEEGER